MGLCALNFSRLDSVDDLDLLSTAVSRVISNAWDANARSITVTTRSKEWWNDECRSFLDKENIIVVLLRLKKSINQHIVLANILRINA